MKKINNQEEYNCRSHPDKLSSEFLAVGSQYIQRPQKRKVQFKKPSGTYAAVKNELKINPLHS